MKLELSREEVELLEGILRDRLGSLREQVYHSDTTSFKDQLKGQEKLLQALVGRVEGLSGQRR